MDIYSSVVAGLGDELHEDKQMDVKRMFDKFDETWCRIIGLVFLGKDCLSLSGEFNRSVQRDFSRVQD